MIESIKHAEKELEHFKSRPDVTEELLSIIRLELITAFRAGYELACKNQFEMGMPYVPKEDDFSSRESFSEALDRWRKLWRNIDVKMDRGREHGHLE